MWLLGVFALALALPADARAQGFDVWQSLWGPGRKSSGEFFRSAAEPAPADSFTFNKGKSSIAVGGQIFVRGESRANEDFNGAAKDNDTFVDHRVRLTLRASIEGVLGFVLEYQDVRTWGSERSTTFTEPFTGVHQGFVDVRPTQWFHLRVGRQELTYGEDRLLGSLDWLMAARSFDGVFVRLSPWRALSIDLFAMNVRERAFLPSAADPNRIPNEGQQLYGLYTRFRLPIAFGIDFYTLGLVTDPTTQATGPRGERGFATIGGRVFGAKGPFSLVTEAAYQIGSDLVGDHRAWAISSRAWFNMPLPGTPYVSFEYSRASGDGNAADGTNTTFQQLFPTGHIHLGYIDYVGWQNVQAYRGTVGFRPKPGAHAWIDVHRFEMVEPKGAWYRASGATFIAADPRRVNLVMGTEVDFTFVWPLYKYISMSVAYSAFFPGDAAKVLPGAPSVGRGTDVSHWAFLYTRAQF
jgi:hypothetical protein